MFTKQFIWITGILHIVFGIGTAVYYLYEKYYSAGIVFALFAIFSIICFISWIPRIPFSVVMLQATMDVAKTYGHVFTVSAIGGFIAFAFGAWFSLTLVAVYVQYQPNNNGSNPSCGTSGCSTAKVVGLIVFITFAGYWISEWIKNTIHSTVAGVYGSVRGPLSLPPTSILLIPQTTKTNMRFSGSSVPTSLAGCPVVLHAALSAAQ